MKRSRPAFRLALCSLLAALGAVIMMSGGLVPILTYCSPLVAGLLMIFVLREYGMKQAWMTWAVTAILSLILCPDRESAFFYVFMGCYPMIREMLGRIGSKPIRFLAKICFICAMLALMYTLLLFVLRMDALTEELNSMGTALRIGFFAGMLAVMLLYDRAICAISRLYGKRRRKKAQQDR